MCGESSYAPGFRFEFKGVVCVANVYLGEDSEAIEVIYYAIHCRHGGDAHV